MPYPDWSNISKPTELFRFINENTSGWFGNLLPVAIFVMMIIAAYDRTRNIKTAFGFSCFVTAVASIIMMLAGWVPNYFGIISVVLIIAGVIALMNRDTIEM